MSKWPFPLRPLRTFASSAFKKWWPAGAQANAKAADRRRHRRANTFLNAEGAEKNPKDAEKTIT